MLPCPRHRTPAVTDDLAASGEAYVVQSGDWLMQAGQEVLR